MTHTNPNLLDCNKVAAMLGLTPRTIRGRKDRGALPAPTISKPPYRWDRTEIEAWIAHGMPDRGEWERLKRRASIG